MKERYQREEYTRLRSAAMKRIRRAKEAGFSDLPQIMGQEYLLPPLKSIPRGDINQLKFALGNVQMFLALPTTIPALRVEAVKLEEESMRHFKRLGLKEGEGRLFRQFYAEADSRMVEKIDYELRGSFITKRSVEVRNEIREAFEQWKQDKGFVNI